MNGHRFQWNRQRPVESKIVGESILKNYSLTGFGLQNRPTHPEGLREINRWSSGLNAVPPPEPEPKRFDPLK